MTQPGAERSITDVLREVVQALDDARVPYMLVGAYAVFAHGDPRTSRDIDIVIDARGIGADSIRPTLERAGFVVDGPERDEFATKFTVVDPIAPVEIYYGLGGANREREFRRREKVAYGDREYDVMSKEDLVLWKLLALLNRRAQTDLQDISSILTKQWLRFDFDYVRLHCDRRVRATFEQLADLARKERVRLGLPI
jgi:hypothetical protein